MSQLALRGFDANMTLGNTKNVDILVSDPKTGRMFKIEVKTHYRNNPAHSTLFGHTLDWVMTQKNESVDYSNLFYVFVNITNDTVYFRFFIVPSTVVARYVKEQHEFWLKSRVNDVSEGITLRRFRMGLDDGGYSISTPLAKEYENKWVFEI